MAVSFNNLVGARENLDETIRDLISDNWNSANTSTVTPITESDTSEPDFLATHDNSVLDGIYIRFNRRERISDDSMEANGDGIHLWATTLVIDIYAQTLAILTQFEDEVNRILWENAPNSSTRLPKSDGNNSEVSYFEKTEIEFERIDPDEPTEENDVNPTSQGVLVCVYQKSKT